MAHRGRISLVLAALVALTAGVLTTGAADAAAPKPPPTVKVSVTGTRLVHLPGTMRPGLHRFHVTSAKVSNFEIGKPKAGYTKKEFARDSAAGSKKAFVRTETNFSRRGGTFTDKDQSAVMFAYLSRGTYWVYDNEAATIQAAKIKTLKVSGARLEVTTPTTTGTLHADKANTWGAKPEAIAHAGIVRLRNSTGQPFQLVLEKLKDGKTYADFQSWVAAGQPDDSYPLDDSVQFLTGALGAGQTALSKYSLPAGNYVMTSFWLGLNGQYQAANGMNRGLTLN